MKNNDIKIKRFELRTTYSERSKISRLAKRLKVKSEAEAIRLAVSHMLEFTEIRRDQFPNAQPQT